MPNMEIDCTLYSQMKIRPKLDAHQRKHAFNDAQLLTQELKSTLQLKSAKIYLSAALYL